MEVHNSATTLLPKSLMQSCPIVHHDTDGKDIPAPPTCCRQCYHFCRVVHAVPCRGGLLNAGVTRRPGQPTGMLHATAHLHPALGGRHRGVCASALCPTCALPLPMHVSAASSTFVTQCVPICIIPSLRLPLTGTAQSTVSSVSGCMRWRPTSRPYARNVNPRHCVVHV